MRPLGGLVALAWALLAVPLTATPPMPPRPGPPESRPATLPALKAALAEKWLACKAMWRAGEWAKLEAAESELYNRSLADAGRWQIRSLAAEMARTYHADRRGDPDDYRSCRLAYLIFVTMARSLPRRERLPPRRPTGAAMKAFLAEWRADRADRAEAGLWAFRVVETACGNIADPERKADAFRRAYAVMTPATFFCMPFVSDPRPLAARFEKIRPKLAEFADGDPGASGRRRRQLKGMADGLSLLVRRAADKRAVLAALEGYRKAYNRKDDAAFARVCSALDVADDPTRTRPAVRKPLESVIPAARWSILLIEPYAAHVDGDDARIELFIRYADRSGKAGPIRQDTFHADKAAGRWRLR